MEDQGSGHILVVDDNRLNRMLLVKMLGNLGHQVSEAVNGVEALELLHDPATPPVDVALLDILMPELDGYGLLEEIKSDSRLHHIPVIMISALDELASVVRCIEIGATDYLTKPIQPSLLKARLKASLAEKQLRDLEREYLEQVGLVVSAAEAVENAVYDPETLESVAGRSDALGRLARVFKKMAKEVHLREQRLKQQLAQLQLDIEEMQKAQAEELEIYLPMDRRQALHRQVSLPGRSTGTVLFADISDYTGMTALLAEEYGGSRGAEEITRLINQIFAALIEEVHAFRGSVIGFGGDAITCWFDTHTFADEDSQAASDPGLRAMACGQYMQTALLQFDALVTGKLPAMNPAIKVVIISGPAQRLLVGDPGLQVIETLVGAALDRLETAEKLVNRGEVIVDAQTLAPHAGAFEVSDRRSDPATGMEFLILKRLLEQQPPKPWAPLPEKALPNEVCRPWLHPAVYRLAGARSRHFLSELRPAAALFLHFQGFDFENDSEASGLLDEYIRWIQRIIHAEEGAVLQLTFGDKGSYLYAAFGAPTAHADDALRAVRSAFQILDRPPGFDRVRAERIGITFGEMRSGSYGGNQRRTYGVLGTQTNLAARLMQAAGEREILVDRATRDACMQLIDFTRLPEIQVKGRVDTIEVFRPINDRFGSMQTMSDSLRQLGAHSPAEQALLKMASVIGEVFDENLLADILADDGGPEDLGTALASLTASGTLQRLNAPGRYRFAHAHLQEAAYQSMLYVQRRHIHRRTALAIEARHHADLAVHLPDLARHWQAADETTRAIDYLEKAGRTAQEAGELENAQAFFTRSLELAASRAVLSKDYLE